jgi:hypothetical protein
MADAEVSTGQLGFVDKLLLAAACLLSMLLFCSIGRLAAGPMDPLGSMALLDQSSPVAAVIELMGLAVVVAGLAGVLLRGRLVDFGLFVVALGLAAMNVRGAQVDHLVRYAPQGTTRSAVFLLLAVEVLAWMLVMLAAAASDALVSGWFDTAHSGQAGHRLVGLGELLLGRSRWQSGVHEIRNGLLCFLLCAVAAAVLIRMFGGPALSIIRKGQVYFSLAAAFFVAGLVAQQLSRARLMIWPLLAVPLVATVGYVAGGVQPHASVPPIYEGLEHIMPNFLCRALPVEYFSAGVAGVVLAGWTNSRLRSRRPKT